MNRLHLIPLPDEGPHTAWEYENWACYECQVSLDSDGVCPSCGVRKQER